MPSNVRVSRQPAVRARLPLREHPAVSRGDRSSGGGGRRRPETAAVRLPVVRRDGILNGSYSATEISTAHTQRSDHNHGQKSHRFELDDRYLNGSSSTMEIATARARVAEAAALVVVAHVGAAFVR